MTTNTRLHRRSLLLATLLLLIASHKARAEQAVIVVEGEDRASRQAMLEGATAVLENGEWDVLSDTSDKKFRQVARCFDGGAPTIDCVAESLARIRKDHLLYFRFLPGEEGPSSARIALALFRKDGYFKQEIARCAACGDAAAVNRATRRLTARSTGLAMPEERKPTGSVIIVTIPAGADISIDGKPTGKSGQVFEMTEGLHLITVTLDGYASQQRTVEVNLEKNDPLVFNLSSPESGDGVEPSREPSGPPFGVSKWVTGVAGVAFIAAGGVALAFHGKARFEEEEGLPPRRLDEEWNTAPIGFLSIGLGAALGVTSVLMFRKSRQGGDEDGAEELSVQISSDGVGFGFSGRF